MDAEVQRKAQARADRIAAFRAQLAELEQEQGLLLTVDQRSHLDTHLAAVLGSLAREYKVETTDSGRRISWGMRTASLLGAMALFAALVLFLQRVWGLLPEGAHMPVLAVFPLLLLGAAELAFRRGGDRFYLLLPALAAGAAFVMGVNALGETRNLAPSPHALGVWGTFAVLLAYGYGLRLLLAAGLVLLCAYTAALWVAATGGYWVDFGQRAGTVIPAAVVVYLFPAFSRRRSAYGFEAGFRLCGGALLLLALLVLSLGGDLCCGGLSLGTMEAVCQLAGLALGGAMTWHGLRLGQNAVVNLGALGFTVFLFTRLQAWWWHWMPKYLFFLLLSLLAFLLLLSFQRLRKLSRKGGAA